MSKVPAKWTWGHSIKLLALALWGAFLFDITRWCILLGYRWVLVFWALYWTAWVKDAFPLLRLMYTIRQLRRP